MLNTYSTYSKRERKSCIIHVFQTSSGLEYVRLPLQSSYMPLHSRYTPMSECAPRSAHPDAPQPPPVLRSLTRSLAARATLTAPGPSRHPTRPSPSILGLILGLILCNVTEI